MWQLLAVAIGGAMGSAVRYGVAQVLPTAADARLPWATIAVNVVGSFLLGVLTAMALRPDALSPALRLMITTGFCGGLTTYSTFNVETLALIEDGKLALAAVNVGGTVAVCLMAGFAGLAAGRALFPAP